VLFSYFSLELNRQGDVMASGASPYDLTDRDVLAQLLGGVLDRREKVGVLEEFSLRYYHTSSPGGHRIVFADLSSERNLRSNLIKTCLFIGGGSFLLFFIISLFLARWAIKPGEQAWTQQKQFVADASHELKTPLTVILTNAELLQNQACDSQQQEQCSNSILSMASQMRGLVERLLELARVDSGTSGMVFSNLDFSTLVSDSILPFEPLFFEQGLQLNSQIASDLSVHASPSHLRQLMDILLDNGMKYSSPSGTVDVCLKRYGNHALLTVATPGDQISREDLKNIFKRFYRVDKARSINGSYGLGLSIAQRIITEHRGKIWAESYRGINTFYVHLPLSRGTKQ
jgi:signal transduction histidine kinase